MNKLHPSIYKSIHKRYGLLDPIEDPHKVTGFEASSGSGRIGSLKIFDNLSGIGITSWESPELSDLWTLPNIGERLFRISFRRSNVPDVKPLTKMRSLNAVNFVNSQTFDLRPISELPNLKILTVQGCALDEHSFKVILPQMREAGIKCQFGKILYEREWLMMQRTKERGLSVCISRNNYGETYVMVPGQKCTSNAYWGLDPIHFEEILEAIPTCNNEEFFLAAEAWSSLTTFEKKISEAKANPEKITSERLKKSREFCVAKYLEYSEKLTPLMTPIWKSRIKNRWSFN